MDTNLVITLVTAGGVVVTACITLIGTCLTVYHGRRLNEVNDAVNHRHVKTDDESAPKLYDLAWENRARVNTIGSHVVELIGWKDQYKDGPLDTGDKVKQFVRETREHFDRIETKVDNIAQRPGCGFKEGE